MTKRVCPSRREFLSSTAFAAASLVIPGHGRGEMSMKKIAPNQASDNFRADVDLELVAKPGSASILHWARDQRLALFRETALGAG